MYENGNPSPKSASRHKNVLMAFTIITLVAFNVVQFYINQKNENDRVSKYETKQKELVDTYTKLDTISTQLTNRIDQLRALGGSVDSLIAIKNQLEREKYALLKARDLADERYQEIKESLGRYELLLVQKDGEIKELRERNVVLQTENSVLWAEQNRLSEALNRISGEKIVLETQVKEGAVIRTKAIQFFATGKDGKVAEGSNFKAASLSRLSAKVNLAHSPLVKLGNKRIYMCITDPNDDVLSNPGAATFSYKGSDIFYSAFADFPFDNSGQSVDINYAKSGAFKAGSYKVVFYCDGQAIGEAGFIVR